ncbi:unnamed protein product [Pedinophyceae sp. YPF-701]|nr:unnamed protein product [Pedinophyceae sp. YPF-701]
MARPAGRRRAPHVVGLILGILLLACGPSHAHEADHKYEEGEAVTLWVNKVGPFNNPQETYNYYSLPFCHNWSEKKLRRKWAGIGEAVQGNELIDSGFAIKFNDDVAKTSLCEVDLDEASVQSFVHAIRSQYWYELYIDDLPMWGFVGEAVMGGLEDAAPPAAGGEGGHPPEELVFYVYTHQSFAVGVNGERIVEVNLTASDPQELRVGGKLAFHYSVEWHPSEVPFDMRYDRYLDNRFFEHNIHWFSLFNSFMMVIFLIGIVALILLRTLRKDISRYAASMDVEAVERDLADEFGWKMVHGDVFRPAHSQELLCALVGTGIQLAALVLVVVAIAIMRDLHESRGAILSTFIALYSFSSLVGGYVSGSLYARREGQRWIRTMVLTSVFFPGVVFGVAFCINVVALFYGSLAAASPGTVALIVAMWALISFPMTLIGTVTGRHWNGAPDNPCRVKRIPSPVPMRAWYLRPLPLALAGGVLPFGSIFIEMYFVFTSFWNYKVYYVYGFMLVVLLILIVVQACCSVVGTYLLLNAEDHRWQWASFGTGFSTSLYVFLYSVHYFMHKTAMSGLFQTTFYFGTQLMLCLGLGLTCGAVGHIAANAFVRRIYRSVKCD